MIEGVGPTWLSSVMSAPSQRLSGKAATSQSLLAASASSSSTFHQTFCRALLSDALVRRGKYGSVLLCKSSNAACSVLKLFELICFSMFHTGRRASIKQQAAAAGAAAVVGGVGAG